MSISRVKTWRPGEELAANDLENEFNNLCNSVVVEPFVATQPVDLNGQVLILDADGNTLIDGSVDDTIDITIGGNDDFRITPNLLTALDGSSIQIVNGTLTISSGTVTISSGSVILGNGALWLARSASVLSAATTDIWSTDGNSLHITGAVTITSLGTAPQAGAGKWVIFDDALTLTHGANLTLPGGVSITTAAGDAMFVLANTTTQHNVVSYIRASGVPLGAGTATQGSSLVFIETLNLATTNTVTNLGSTYDIHIFELFDVVPGTTGTDLRITFSTDNGATFANSQYQYSSFNVNVSGAVAIPGAVNQTIASANDSLCGRVTFYKPYKTNASKQILVNTSYAQTAVGLQNIVLSGTCTDASPNVVTSAINAIKFAYSAGTIAGTLRHYGVKNS